MKKTFILGLCLSLLACKDIKKDQSIQEDTLVTNEVTAEADFYKKLAWNTTSFEVKFEQGSLQVIPSGLEIVNDIFEHSLVGVSVADALVADLNGDGHAEVLVHLVSDGSGSYGDLIVYSVNNGKSMSTVYYNSEIQDKQLAEGYMGHDSFVIMDGILHRTFPIYKEGDTNAEPTGGTRILQYRLIDGEANRQLVLSN